jgi:hypothetical protein
VTEGETVSSSELSGFLSLRRYSGPHPLSRKFDRELEVLGPSPLSGRRGVTCQRRSAGAQGPHIVNLYPACEAVAEKGRIRDLIYRPRGCSQ